LATFPAPAAAAVVSFVAPGTIIYEAAPGEANSLTVVRDFTGYYVFMDSGASLVALGACASVDFATVRCPGVGVQEIDVFLADGNDQLLIGDSASAPGVPSILADGGEDADSLRGGPGPEALSGGAGDDISFGGGGDDNLIGGSGNDDLISGSGNDVLQGGDGNDRLSAAREIGGSDLLDGGPGDDLLSVEGQGPDTVSGGDGIDTVDFSERTSSVKIDVDGAADDGERGEHDNVKPDVENVIGGSESDTLTGSGAPNFIDGRNGDDQLNGGGGDDTLDGGANNPGSDNLDGGDGRDLLYGRAGDDSLDGGQGDDSLSGAGGTDTLDGEDGNDTLAGGSAGDALDGGAGDDVLDGAEADLIGADGADTLVGGPGMDVLLGNNGNDELNGGPGPDQISGQAGKDTVIYEHRSSPVTVNLNDLPDDGEQGEGDNVRPDVEVVLAGKVDDNLWGDGDANTLDGGAGEDLVTGNSGRDRLDGGDASDLIRARDGDRDIVDCGRDRDLAIVDGLDELHNCETVDGGGKRRLVVGRRALVRPTQRQFGLRFPGAHRFFPLKEALTIPIASTIDPQTGEVRVATARSRAGARQEISVSAGVFSLRQKTGRRPITELRLTGRSFGVCGRSSRGRRAATDKPVRRLVTRVDKRKRGPFRVRGRYSIAGAVGTAWLTEDRCDGTLTRVDTGTVRVHDLVRHRTVTVRAGESYLARAP
jgi:Ca2+-binding RTX toxin-like protein